MLDFLTLEDGFVLGWPRAQSWSPGGWQAGSHFAIITKDQTGERSCVLEYDFKKSKPQNPPTETTDEALTDELPPEEDSDGNTSSAPFKKKVGPLQISNIGLQYVDKILQVQFTATFELGPLAFSLIDFRLHVKITSLRVDGLEMLLPTLEGLSASFEKPPLTIAGLIRHGQSDSGLDYYYAGGLIVGWEPYQLQAAGFYGEALPEGGKRPTDVFKSVFVFARLDGPLATLEFAEISGVTGGFGYQFKVRVHTAEQVVDFPFVKPTSLAGATESAITTLERLTSPAADGWFQPREDTYWAAVGMKIDAFQMISLDAVVVVQFGQSIIMGLFAVALADIPTSASEIKFAHVELGIAAVIDLDHGTFRAEAQLSPNSYILDPNCHLTGGFALCYWFDGPHADRSLIGDFIFTLGGYHKAFDVPDGYPNPPRLEISWSLGDALSITGQAYFAITPKAWFDAFADFLINYKPFHFLAEAGISVGVRFSLDIWFIHIHLSVEVGADLTLLGPPMAGCVHVDIKVAKFNINFGSKSDDTPPANLLQFYHLVLQASSKSQTPSRVLAASEFTSQGVEGDSGEQLFAVAAAGARVGAEDNEGDDDPPKQDEGHTFLAQSGLMTDTDKPERSHNQAWTVRGGTFSFILGCKMSIAKAEQVDSQGKPVDDPNAVVEYTDKTIHARPMCLTAEQILDSTVKISITEDHSDDPPRAWRMERIVKNVPTGLWAEYDKTLDPKHNGNYIGELLNTANGGVPLMMGVLLAAPPPFMSEDKLQTFKILDADRQDIAADLPFPAVVSARKDWLGVAPPPDQKPAAQWEAVRATWEVPDWDKTPPSNPTASGPADIAGSSGASEAEVGGVQTTFVASWAKAFGWDAALATLAEMPSLLNKRFDNLYVAAPLLTN